MSSNCSARTASATEPSIDWPQPAISRMPSSRPRFMPSTRWTIAAASARAPRERSRSREAMVVTVSRTLAIASFELCASLRICSLKAVERSDRLRTSSATTAKPRPASPARAASMAALSASRLVWSAIDFTSSSRAKMPSRCSAIASMWPTVVPLWPATSSSASTSCSILPLACTANWCTSMPPSAPLRSRMRVTTSLWRRDWRFIASKLPPSRATDSRIRSRVRSISVREPSTSAPTKLRSSSSSLLCSRTSADWALGRCTYQASTSHAAAIATVAPSRAA